jgi:hypothetical protein
MKYNKKGNWENACNRADVLSSNKRWQNKRSKKKVVDGFSSFPSFLLIAENLNLRQVG